MRCDCRKQLELALSFVQRHGGCVIYLQQEGRGIGLANKIAAYNLQDGGLDTVDANRHLGFEDDERSYECLPMILDDLGIRSVRLLTNNPFKVACLEPLGVRLPERIPIIPPRNQWNEGYVQTKISRMGHLSDGRQGSGKSRASGVTGRPGSMPGIGDDMDV